MGAKAKRNRVRACTTRLKQLRVYAHLLSSQTDLQLCLTFAPAAELAVAHSQALNHAEGGHGAAIKEQGAQAGQAAGNVDHGPAVQSRETDAQKLEVGHVGNHVCHLLGFCQGIVVELQPRQACQVAQAGCVAGGGELSGGQAEVLQGSQARQEPCPSGPQLHTCGRRGGLQRECSAPLDIGHQVKRMAASCKLSCWQPAACILYTCHWPTNGGHIVQTELLAAGRWLWHHLAGQHTTGCIICPAQGACLRKGT